MQKVQSLQILINIAEKPKMQRHFDLAGRVLSETAVMCNLLDSNLKLALTVVMGAEVGTLCWLQTML